MKSIQKLVLALLMGAFFAPVASLAENRTYGSVDLTGLARQSWPYNPAGEMNAMVCNVNGPDGWLAIRSGPGTRFEAKRKLKRLAIVVVDTRKIRGNWVRVVDAYRTHSIKGRRIKTKSLHVKGWTHTKYLCDFLD
jgi:hypothetical protein